MTDTFDPSGRPRIRKAAGTTIPGEPETRSLEKPAPKAKAAPPAPYVTPEPPEGDLDEGSKRIEEIRARRRERGNVDVSGFTQKLSVPEERKDPRFVYRWALDSANRMHDLRAKDWDPAPAETTAGDLHDMGTGTVVERMGNVKTVPKPERHVLVRKPREFYEEDKAREAKKLKEQEKAIVGGQVRNAEGQPEPGMYIPSGGMKIEHGR
jgi:hypothetical protein